MSDDDARSPGFASLSSMAFMEDANLRGALQRVAASGCAVLSNCEAASVTIVERGKAFTVGATNETAQALDDVQYAGDSGPCLSAAREGQLVRIDDTGADTLWPEFSTQAVGLGIHSSLSAPLTLNGENTTGGFNAYGSTVAGFTDDDVALCESFAVHASIVVGNARVYWAAIELSRSLAAAMESRAVIEQAKGILMSTHRVDADDAFALLRQRSQRANRKLRTVAAEVVAEATEAEDENA